MSRVCWMKRVGSVEQNCSAWCLGWEWACGKVKPAELGRGWSKLDLSNSYPKAAQSFPAPSKWCQALVGSGNATHRPGHGSLGRGWFPGGFKLGKLFNLLSGEAVMGSVEQRAGRKSGGV